MRGVCCLAVVLLGCAAEVATSELKSAGDGEIHDALAERTAASVQVEPPAPRVRRDVLLRRPAYWPSEPPPMLRGFSAAELERITRVQSIVDAAARESGLPPDLVNGIIWVESKFQPNARSNKRARGLMQLMPGTAREIAREIGREYDPFDPEFNIHAGAAYFAHMLQRYDGNLRLALAAYNAGPGVVDRWVRDAEPLPDYSRTYVERVFTAARTFRAHDP